jgi:hypothetical protein
VLQRGRERSDVAVELDGRREQEDLSLECREREEAREPVDGGLETVGGRVPRDRRRRRLTVAESFEHPAEVLHLPDERRLLALGRRRLALDQDGSHAGTVTL